jgi:PII-like signaling protein
METPRDAILLRVFIGEADRKAGRALYRVLIEAAYKAGLAGATALHGPLSYGQSRHVNSELSVDAPGNLPMVVEIVDTGAKIEGFLPELEKLVGSGLVTLEKVRMARVGTLTKGRQDTLAAPGPAR